MFMPSARHVLAGLLVTGCSLDVVGLASSSTNDSGAADASHMLTDVNAALDRAVTDDGAVQDGGAHDAHADRTIARESGSDGGADHSVHDAEHPPVDAGGDVNRADSPGSCDASVADDPNNCGACGHSCGGGECVEAVCQPSNLVILQTGQTVRAVAVDSTYLYWSNTTDMTVVRANLDGTSPMTLVTGVNAMEIAVDTHALYYTNGSLVRMPFAATVSSTLASGPNGCIWLTSSGLAYAVEYGSPGAIYSVDLADGGVTLLGGLSTPWGVASTATDLYWTYSGTDEGAILRQAWPSGTPVTISSGLDNPNCLSLDETGQLYWPDYNSGVIHRCNPDGGSNTTLATAQVTPTTVAVSPTYIYWNSANNLVRLAR
jgi:hypothetical protein